MKVRLLFAFYCKVERFMSDEVARMWKEMIMAYCRYYAIIIVKRLKNSQRISDWPTARPCHTSLASNSGDQGSSPGQVMWDLWWTKWHWGRFSRSTSVSSATHSTDCTHHHPSSSGAGTRGQTVAEAPSCLGLTTHQETKNKTI
jgi:hypothetical protein